MLALIIGLVALLASGYISALRPGGTVDSSKNVTAGGGTSNAIGSSNKSVMYNTTRSAIPAGTYGAEQPEYAQQQQTGPESQQAYMPQPSNAQQPGEYIPQQPDQTGTINTPTPEPSATISPGTGNEGSVTPTTSPAIQPGMPDMSEYIAGWQAAIEQFYRLMPYIFSRQFGFMPSWPAWTPSIKTI